MFLRNIRISMILHCVTARRTIIGARGVVESYTRALTVRVTIKVGMAVYLVGWCKGEHLCKMRRIYFWHRNGGRTKSINMKMRNVVREENEVWEGRE